jgi:hypothetical protein
MDSSFAESLKPQVFASLKAFRAFPQAMVQISIYAPFILFEDLLIYNDIGLQRLSSKCAVRPQK